jgi:hypothetical protein
MQIIGLIAARILDFIPRILLPLMPTPQSCRKEIGRQKRCLELTIETLSWTELIFRLMHKVRHEKIQGRRFAGADNNINCIFSITLIPSVQSQSKPSYLFQPNFCFHLTQS